MTVRWVATPVDNHIRTIFDLAQSCRRFANALKSHTGWAMTNGGSAIDVCGQQIGHLHRLSLRFAGGIAHAVDNRKTGIDQNLRRLIDRFVKANLFTLDHRYRPTLVDRVLGEPSFA